MKKQRTMSAVFRYTKITLALLATLGLCGCNDDTGKNPQAGEPLQPPQYQAENTSEIYSLKAYYDFEKSLAESGGNADAAETVGRTTAYPGLGNIRFDERDGIHALSSAAVLDGNAGLLFPADLIADDTYTVSLWVKPEAGNGGPLFFVESNGNTLTLDGSGLTVAGQTGFGFNGDEPVTYTSDTYNINAGEWSHVAFTVDEGFVDIYINGKRVYQAGTLVDNGTTFASGWKMETDAFADLFSAGDTSVAIGVTNSEDTTPFAGKIDNLRVFDSALYYGNIMVLWREVTHEGPLATITPTYVEPDIDLSWEIERFNAERISLSRTTFREDKPETEILTDADNPLDGSVTRYTDVMVPKGENYRYTLQAIDSEGHIYHSDPTPYLRVPGDAPYAAVTAVVNEDTENIELTLYTENLDLQSYDLWRGTDAEFINAAQIATGLDTPEYTDEKADENSPIADGTRYYYWAIVRDSVTGVSTTSLPLPAASVTAAGEFVPPGTFVLEEQADGFCGVDGLIETEHLPANEVSAGNKYVNTDNAEGKAVRWRIEVPEAGTFSVYLRYGNGAADDRWGRLDANGSVLLEQFNLPSTGDWKTWKQVKRLIELDAGVYDLALVAGSAGGLANIDHIRFEANSEGQSEPVGVPCAE